MLKKNILLIISIVLLCAQIPAVAQTTTFTASPQIGCDSLDVSFTFESTLNVNSVKWTFGDGSKSYERTPVHKYTKPGNYLVSLVINNNADSVAKAEFIQIGKTPAADILYHDTLDLGSNTIAFSPGQKIDTRHAYNYSWSLSDGETANTSNFFHKFDTTGIYSMQLIVTDVLGCADTIVKSIDVRDELKVPNVFTPNDDNVNDLLIVEGNGVTTYGIKIFARTGIKVFETEAKVLVWDGRMFSGEKVRDGIYYYVIDSPDNSLFKQTGFFYIYGSYQDGVKPNFK